LRSSLAWRYETPSHACATQDWTQSPVTTLEFQMMPYNANTKQAIGLKCTVRLTS